MIKHKKKNPFRILFLGKLKNREKVSNSYQKNEEILSPDLFIFPVRVIDFYSYFCVTHISELSFPRGLFLRKVVQSLNS